MKVSSQDTRRDGPTVRSPFQRDGGRPPKINLRKAGPVNIVEMAGRMTLGEGNLLLRDAVQRLLEEGENRIVLDMLDVPVLDSASVGEIVACNKRVAASGGDLKLVIRGKVLDTFRMTRLDRVFDVHGEVDDALAAFSL